MAARSHRRRSVPVSSRTDRQGTVIAPHEQSVRAGRELLEAGGNAVDAAVGAALVAGVVEPAETTLAGSGFLLFHDGRQRQPWAVNFGPKAPLAATESMFDLADAADSSAILGLAPVVGNANVDGPLANGVPRTLLGLLSAHARWGRLGREIVCAPAIRAAHDGFPADPWFVLSALSDLERLRASDAARNTFLDEKGLPLGHTSSRPYGVSFDRPTLVRQPLLARTLERASVEPLSVLTTGLIGQELVETAREVGGLLSLADLRAAAPDVEPALTQRYRDADISVPTAPGGGVTELQALAVWEAMHPDPTTSQGSAEQTRQLALALRHVFADRYHWLGDPGEVAVPTTELLNVEYAAGIAQRCLASRDVPGWSDGPPWLTYASHPVHDPWKHSDGANPAPVWLPGTATEPTSGTTHLSVADADGGIVSITHTAANHFGSGVMCPRTGLLFDSAMAWFNAAPGAANSIRPGARALANMGPMLITREGRSVAALGASGGRRIISAMVQLVINIVDGNCGPGAALELPRIEASGPKLLVHEARAEDASDLNGIDAEIIGQSNWPYVMDFGRPNIAGYDEQGTASSAIDTTGHND